MSAAPSPDPTWSCVRADGTPHGPFVTLFPDGTAEIRGRRSDGELDGAWMRAHPDGTLAEQGQFTRGRKTGAWQQRSRAGALLGDYTLTAGTGVEKRWYESGALYDERALVDGSPHGPRTIYGEDRSMLVTAEYRDGRLDGRHRGGPKATIRIDENFVAGVRTGPRKIWHSGVLVADERYDAGGKIDGPYRSWRGVRSPLVSGRYAHGRRVGTWTWFDASGAKEKEGAYVGGMRDGAWTEWERGTITATGSFARGYPTGEHVRFDPKGRELGRFTIAGGAGTVLTFHPNGKVASRSTLSAGRPNGAYQELTPRGTVVVEGRFRDGEKHGAWKRWTASRALLLEQNYKAGKLDGHVRKYANGILVSDFELVGGRAHGAYVEYREGVVRLTGSFVEDRRHGTWTTFDREGRAVGVATYDRGTLNGPWRHEIAGVLQEGTMVQGRRTGTWTTKRPDGNVSTITYGRDGSVTR